MFGSDICTCRPYLIYGIEEAVKEVYILPIHRTRCEELTYKRRHRREGVGLSFISARKAVLWVKSQR